MTSSLIELAFTFSPLVEKTAADTVVLDVSGQDLLFGQADTTGKSEADITAARNIADEIFRRAHNLDLNVSVSIAANPDVAIHAARAFQATTVISRGEELAQLESLSVSKLDYSLVEIEASSAEELQQTLALWGVRTFGDLAKLPLTGVAERLGQAGVRLQRLAQGKTDRRLSLVRPPIGFTQSLELEHAIAELEPLSFILSRLLNQLCANLHEYALAANEVRLRLVTESVRTPLVCNRMQHAGGVRTEHAHERTITLPVPMRNPKTLLRLLLLDIEARPPSSPIVAVTISAEPVKPRAAQIGLFIPPAPEPEKLEITLARLAKLVGPENVGSPELLDTHRPDAFRIKRFSLPNAGKRTRSNPQSALPKPRCVMGFRMFRPAWRAEVQTMRGQPTRINARAKSSANVRGNIVCAAGPWRSSGDWWRADVWARDEWDVAVIDPASGGNEVLCRIYRDLPTQEWFVAGIYD